MLIRRRRNGWEVQTAKEAEKVCIVFGGGGEAQSQPSAMDVSLFYLYR